MLAILGIGWIGLVAWLGFELRRMRRDFEQYEKKIDFYLRTLL